MNTLDGPDLGVLQLGMKKILKRKAKILKRRAKKDLSIRAIAKAITNIYIHPPKRAPRRQIKINWKKDSLGNKYVVSSTGAKIPEQEVRSIVNDLNKNPYIPTGPTPLASVVPTVRIQEPPKDNIAGFNNREVELYQNSIQSLANTAKNLGITGAHKKAELVQLIDQKEREKAKFQSMHKEVDNPEARREKALEARREKALKGVLEPEIILETVLDSRDYEERKKKESEEASAQPTGPKPAWLVLEEKRKAQEGSSRRVLKDTDKGLSNLDIDDIMDGYPEYMGCIAHNEIKSQILPRVKKGSRGGFVINTEPASKNGQHWQAVYYQCSPYPEMDWFDSYGDPCGPSLMRDLKLIADRLDCRAMMKFKENRIRVQGNTNNCGFHSCKFLIDRFNGKNFVDASGYNDSQHGEAQIKKFKSQVGFGYIPSWTHSLQVY